MIIARARLSRRPGTQGSLAKVLLDGAAQDASHGLVWSLFSTPDDRKRPFQYRRIDRGTFLVVAERPPEDPHKLWEIEHKPYDVTVAPGDRLGFVLRANPTRAVSAPGRARSTRVDVIMHAKHALDRTSRRAFTPADVERVALDWLIARGPALGVIFDRAHCTAGGYTSVAIAGRRTAGHRGRPTPIRFSQIDYAGVLTVDDPAKLTAALHTGIGSAKSYGCGLLLVRPVGAAAGEGDDDD